MLHDEDQDEILITEQPDPIGASVADEDIYDGITTTDDVLAQVKFAQRSRESPNH